MSSKTLHSQRILLTGGSGFIGARVAEMLAGRGHTLALLVRKPEAAWRIQPLFSSQKVIKADLSDEANYREAVHEFKPDILLHMAWAASRGEENNAVLQARNEAESVALVKTVLEAGAKHVIGLGSQAEYGPQNRRLDETAPTKPTTHYGESKLSVCDQVRRMSEAAGARYAWLRLFSAYGPRDNSQWLIPSLILKLAAGETLKLTAGEQLWDFVFVDDAAAGIVAVVETPEAKGIFNLGSGRAPPLCDTIRQIHTLMQAQSELKFGEIAYRADQVMHLEADITRLMQTTGWHPKTDLPSGLKQTIAWYMSSISQSTRAQHAAQQ